MLERTSALAAHYQLGPAGDVDAAGPGVTLREVRDAGLWQISGWPDTMDVVGDRLAGIVGADAAPGPLQSVTGANGTLLRVQPFVWWLTRADAAVAQQAMEIDADQGTSLDLSHSRTVIRIEGPSARDLLNRGLPTDLRPATFPDGAFVGGAIHLVGVNLHHRNGGYDLYVSRGFAVTLWEFLTETAAQWGYEVGEMAYWGGS
jgi:heterotetrameric sarcosine oxidase gamma subunit